MTLTKKQRAEVFAMFDGHCAYCGCVLPEKGWQPVGRQGCEALGAQVLLSGSWPLLALDEALRVPDGLVQLRWM